MKVCFISLEYPPMIFGGIGTYAEQLVRGISEKGVDIHVITRGRETCRDDKIYRIHVPDILYWRRLFFTKRAINLFNRLNRAHKFDLIHLNGTYPITRHFGLPTVCTIHGPGNLNQMKMLLKLKKFKSVNDATFLFLKSPMGFLCDLGTTKVSDKIICPSPSLVAGSSSRWDYIGAKEKFCVIPNGVDLKQFDSVENLPASVLTNYGIEKENFVLYMGSLSFLKGVDYLIEAFKKVQKRHPTLKLVIAGRGDFEPYLRKIACHMKRVVFLGFVESIRLKKLLYEASLAVVLPSPVYETAPMVILEAMSCNKPVIATNIGGSPYMIRHGENGFLSKPRDSENLANLIDALCENETLRKKMGISGRKLVENEFTSEQMVNRTLKIFESLLD
jgi:glycosyltransferase involved in cell wall biosynthesis